MVDGRSTTGSSPVRRLVAGIVGATLIGALFAPAASMAVGMLAVDDLITTTEDHATVTGNVLENDTGVVRSAGMVTSSTTPGTLTIAENGEYSFTPAANWTGTNQLVAYYYADSDLLNNGGDVITYVRVTVTAVNDVPTANSQSLETNEDTAKAITLAGSDQEGGTLTYSIVTEPAHGALTGSGPARTYTPGPNYHGADSFTFKVNDGTDDSASATVSITVIAVNDVPTANSQSLETDEDTNLPITLTGTDADGDGITYVILSQPSHGQLTGTGANFTYAPTANYLGADSFTFKVNDGTDDSASATVSITVIAVNDVPTANSQSLETDEDTDLPITLSGSDQEGSTLSFEVVDEPLHGTLSGSGASWTYSPDPDHNGADSFTFRAYDGTDYSAAATISIDVVAVGDVPTADAQTVNVVFEMAEELTLTGDDADGDEVAFVVLSQPEHGVLSGTAPDLTYTPADGYVGADSFTFKVAAGGENSSTATVSIVVAADAAAPVVPAPTVAFGAGRVNESAPIKITWSATDSGVGVAGYVVEAKVGTGAWTEIYDGTGTTITKSYPFGQSLQWRVKAHDANHNWSAFTNSAVRRLYAFQGGSPVASTGTWRTVTSPSSSGVNYKYTTTSGKYVKLAFTNAIGVIYVAPKNSAGGYVKVKIDGTTYARNNLRSSTTSYGVIIRGKAWSTAGNHTIWVWNAQSGRRANFDAFIVLK